MQECKFVIQLPRTTGTVLLSTANGGSMEKERARGKQEGEQPKIIIIVIIIIIIIINSVWTYNWKL